MTTKQQRRKKVIAEIEALLATAPVYPSSEVVIAQLADALESTVWSSGCWCSGKDTRGHSATCEGRRAALRDAGRDWP